MRFWTPPAYKILFLNSPNVEFFIKQELKQMKNGLLPPYGNRIIKKLRYFVRFSIKPILTYASSRARGLSKPLGTVATRCSCLETLYVCRFRGRQEQSVFAIRAAPSRSRQNWSSLSGFQFICYSYNAVDISVVTTVFDFFKTILNSRGKLDILRF